jgi:hypothetical protein
MRARALPNPTSLKRIAPKLCRRESGFCGRMVERRPRQLAAAIDVARRVSAPPGLRQRTRLDRDCAGRWRSWRGNGVNHSIVWQYLSNVDRARFDRVMAVAGEAATHNEPLAWLRSESGDNVADVCLQLWTGSNDRLLARRLPWESGVQWLGHENSRLQTAGLVLERAVGNLELGTGGRRTLA